MLQTKSKLFNVHLYWYNQLSYFRSDLRSHMQCFPTCVHTNRGTRSLLCRGLAAIDRRSCWYSCPRPQPECSRCRSLVRFVTMLSGRRLNMMRMSQAEIKYEKRMENVSPAPLLDRLSDYRWKLNWQFALSALTAVLLLWPKAQPVTLFLCLLCLSFRSFICLFLLHRLSSLCLWLCPLNCPVCSVVDLHLSLRGLLINQIQFNKMCSTMS